MHKVVFASIEFDYDFDTKEEAEKYIRDNVNMGWYWESKEPYKQRNGMWSVRVRKPYKDYNPGW